MSENFKNACELMISFTMIVQIFVANFLEKKPTKCFLIREKDRFEFEVIFRGDQDM